MRKLRRLQVDAEMKTDSTGDIAFLLVIFFMLTATFAATRGIEFGLPADEPVQQGEGKPSVLISIAADGAVLVDCTPMQPERIVAYLEPRLLRNPNKPVIVYPDEGAPYSSLVEVLDALATAPERGFSVDNVQICTPQIIRDYLAAFNTDPFADHCVTS